MRLSPSGLSNQSNTTLLTTLSPPDGAASNGGDMRSAAGRSRAPLRKLSGREISQRRVRPHLVVVAPPSNRTSGVSSCPQEKTHRETAPSNTQAIPTPRPMMCSSVSRTEQKLPLRSRVNCSVLRVEQFRTTRLLAQPSIHRAVEGLLSSSGAWDLGAKFRVTNDSPCPHSPRHRLLLPLLPLRTAKQMRPDLDQPRQHLEY